MNDGEISTVIGHAHCYSNCTLLRNINKLITHFALFSLVAIECRASLASLLKTFTRERLASALSFQTMHRIL